jgi:hypothetical protein
MSLTLPLSGVARLRSLGPATKGCGGKWAGELACQGDLGIVWSQTKHLLEVLV